MTTDNIPAEVYEKFEELALTIRGMGFKRYSSDAILHRIRWHYAIERGDRSFRLNDHWTPILARWFLDKHPQYEGFFELRALRQETCDA